MRILALLPLAIAACYAPTFPEGQPCSETGNCPEGQRCNGGVCLVGNPDDPIDAQLFDSTPIDSGPCVGLECFQVECTGGGTTSVSGIVTMPNGTLPIYDALVYVPNGAVPALEPIATCHRCETEVPSVALVSTRTGPDGTFTLENMPATDNVTLVVQVGQWRRQTTILSVPMCEDTPLADDAIRLPRNATEGDLPMIAISTGDADTLECLLRKTGISDSELGIKGSAAHVHLFRGMNGSTQFSPALGGAVFPIAPSALWNSLDNLNDYDVVVLSCEGMAFMHAAAETAAMKNYVDAGGRVFASHFHDQWLKMAPTPWPGTGNFVTSSSLPSPIPGIVDQTFPRGVAFAEWLAANGIAGGQFPINEGRDALHGVMGGARSWLITNGPTTTQHMSFTAPLEVGADTRCGRFMLSELHAAVGDQPNQSNYPNGCTTALTQLTPQEKAILYQFFELGRCVDDSGD